MTNIQHLFQSSEGGHSDRVAYGVACGALSFAAFAVMTSGVKLLSAHHHVIEITFYRNLIAIIPLLTYVFLMQKKALLVPQRPKLLAFRVVLGVFSMFITFASVTYLPLSDATVLFMASTLIIPILGVFILGEKTGWVRICALLVGFAGVVIAMSPTGHAQGIGVAIALAAAFSHALIHVTLRLLRDENAFTVTFYFLLGGVLIPLFFMPWIANPPTWDEAGLFLMIGVTGTLGQYLITAAFKYAPANVVAPFNYTGLLWAALLDFMIWGYIPGWHLFAGGAIIIGAKLFVLHREYRQGERLKNSAISS